MPDTNTEFAKLIEQNDELENYFRNTIIPQLFVDADLILRKFTPPAMKQFNVSAQDIGKSISDIVDNFRFPSIVENIRSVINSGEILEKEIQTTDLRWYQMNILPYVVVATNKTNGVILTFIEITRRIKDLKDQEKLIAENELLLDTISHDIKTPLTNLVLLVELFKSISPENAGEFKELVQMVENSVLKMQHLIADLTNTRMESHKYRTEVELINFEHIMEDVRLTIAENIKESGAIIRTEINVSELIFSRRQIRSIVYNLVNNAIKFKSPGSRPEILVATKREKDYVSISVKDNGIGIDAADRDQIFSKYFSIKNDGASSGIGLYLVNEIVKNAGGHILLQSEPGKGSEFIVYLKM